MLSQGICREEKKMMGFSSFPQNTSAYICVGLVCNSSSSNTNKFFIKCFDTIIFPFFIFQGRETTTWLTSGCSKRRQTHWGMELGFDGFGVSAAEHSPLFSTLIHKYFPSLLYSLSSNQFFFSLKQWMKPRAMQGSHQLNLFPLYCLFDKPVWSVYFFILHYSQINQASCILQEFCSVLQHEIQFDLIFPPTVRICEQCCDQHRYSKLFLLQHHLILCFIFCFTSHWK